MHIGTIRTVTERTLQGESDSINKLCCLVQRQIFLHCPQTHPQRMYGMQQYGNGENKQKLCGPSCEEMREYMRRAEACKEKETWQRSSPVRIRIR